MDPEIAQFKRWVEEVEFGELSERAPLQSAAVRSAWDPSAWETALQRTDTWLAAQGSGATSVNRNSACAPPSDDDIDAAALLFFDCLPPHQPSVYARAPPISEAELLQTLCEFEALSSAAGAANETADMESNKRAKLADMSASRATPISNVVPPAAPLPAESVGTSAHDSLKSRFKSAKTRFKDEGGVLEPPPARKETQSRSAPVPGGSSKEKDLPEALKDFDKALVHKIEADILHHGQAVTFEDISGLEFAKKCVQELICWPMLRPDIFTGLRSLPRGLLLFGPPGTGKTLIGKAIANQTGATFFSISASSLTSKWIGEGEASVKTLFAVANYYQPSVVFIDEIDSLLSQRSSEENEATRRIKTEFLVQLDGAGTSTNAQVVILGATNRPQELDEAARRRLVKRLYVPLPDRPSRLAMLKNLLKNNRHMLGQEDFGTVADCTDGFSGADIAALCTEAAMCPLRELASTNMGGLQSLRESEVPPICIQHFLDARREVSASVSQEDLQKYVDWNTQYGTYRRME